MSDPIKEELKNKSMKRRIGDMEQGIMLFNSVEAG
jgi:hypothetical protein